MSKRRRENLEQWLNQIESGDAIAVVWHIDDVKSMDENLTDDEAREILERMYHKHDATIGISWDTIDAFIDMYKWDKKKEAS